MKLKLAGAAFIAAGCTLALSPALAETAAQIATRLDRVVASGTCPSPPVEVHQNTLYEDCGPDNGRTDSAYLVSQVQCRGEHEKLRKSREVYNAFMRNCQQIRQPAGAPARGGDPTEFTGRRRE